MTREELINFGEMYLDVNNDSKNSNTYEFIEEAVKLFKQEPCEKAVNEGAVKNVLSRQKFVSYEAYLRCIAEIDNLPPATSTCKKGKWIKVDTNMYTCSNCSHCFTIVPEDNQIQQFKYCPNCKMEMEGEE